MGVWTGLNSRDKIHYRAAVNTVTESRVPWKAGDSLTSWVPEHPGGFSWTIRTFTVSRRRWNWTPAAFRPRLSSWMLRGVAESYACWPVLSRRCGRCGGCVSATWSGWWYGATHSSTSRPHTHCLRCWTAAALSWKRTPSEPSAARSLLLSPAAPTSSCRTLPFHGSSPSPSRMCHDSSYSSRPSRSRHRPRSGAMGQPQWWEANPYWEWVP